MRPQMSRSTSSTFRRIWRRTLSWLRTTRGRAGRRWRSCRCGFHAPRLLRFLRAVILARNDVFPSLLRLQVGAVVRGRVTEVHVYHGLKVDIGAEYDAVVPIEKDAFTEMGKAGEIPDIFGRLFRREVDVRLAQIHDPRRFR